MGCGWEPYCGSDIASMVFDDGDAINYPQCGAKMVSASDYEALRTHGLWEEP